MPSFIAKIVREVVVCQLQETNEGGTMSISCGEVVVLVSLLDSLRAVGAVAAP